VVISNPETYRSAHSRLGSVVFVSADCQARQQEFVAMKKVQTRRIGPLGSSAPSNDLYWLHHR
jgi:hypothetical protein